MKRKNSIDSVYNALYKENIRHSSLYEKRDYFAERAKKQTSFMKNENEEDAFEQPTNEVN